MPSSASTTIAAFSIPWPRIATSRATGAWIFGHARRASSRRFQLRAASGVRGRSLGGDEDRDHGRPPLREPARRDEPVAAVVAGAGEDQHRPALAGVERDEGAGGGGDRGPGVLHQRLAGRARAPAPCGRRRSSPRRRSRPRAATSAQRSASSSRRERGQRRVVGGEGGGRGHARRVRERGGTGPGAYRSATDQPGSRASGPSPGSRGPRAARPRASASTASRTAPAAVVADRLAERDPGRPAPPRPVQDPAAEPAAGGRERGLGAAGAGRRGATCGRPLSRRVPAPGDRRAVGAVRPRRACTGAAPRSISAWVQASGRSARDDRVGERLHRPRRERLRPAGRDPPEHPPHVGVDRADRAPRTRSPPPPAPCTARRPATPPAPRPTEGTRPPCSATIDLRRPVEVDRPPVVAEPRPGAEDVGDGRGRQVAHRRPAGHPGRPCLGRPRRLGLLRHELGHEDGVRVRGGPERELAARRVVPGEDGFARGAGDCFRGGRLGDHLSTIRCRRRRGQSVADLPRAAFAEHRGFIHAANPGRGDGGIAMDGFGCPRRRAQSPTGLGGTSQHACRAGILGARRLPFPRCGTP